MKEPNTKLASIDDLSIFKAIINKNYAFRKNYNSFSQINGNSGFKY